MALFEPHFTPDSFQPGNLPQPVLPARLISENSSLLAAYRADPDEVDYALGIATRSAIGPNDAWCGIALVAAGVRNEDAQIADDGLVVIGMSGILGVPEHPEYETAWVAVQELGDYAAGFSQQCSDQGEALAWNNLARRIEYLIRRVAV